MSSFNKNPGISIQHAIPPLHIESWIESPAVIQATLAENNLIQIGGFTGIYGGRLGHCRIGRYCSIAADVNIAADQHPIDWLSTSMFQYVPNIHNWGNWLKEQGESYTPPNNRFSSNSAVTIGNDVWIGQGVFIKSGVTIGNGAIIAARSAVVSDVPPYAIVAGVPAKVKRYRFPPDIIERLNTLQWWNYRIQDISNTLDYSDALKTLEILEEQVDAKKIALFEYRKHSLVTEF